MREALSVSKGADLGRPLFHHTFTHMKNTWLTLTLGAAIVATLTSCSFDVICKRAGGTTETVELAFPAINGIDISGIDEAELSYGPVQKVVITAEQDILDNLNFRVENGTLVTDVQGCWRNYHLKVALTLAEPLAKASTSGAGNITTLDSLPAANDLNLEVSGTGEINLVLSSAKNIDASTSGTGRITLSGTADFLKTQTSGTGTIRAFELIATDNTASTSGTASIELHSGGGFLNASTSGTGNIRYKGTPSSVNAISSGLGRVTKVN